MNIYPNSFEPARCRGCGLEIVWALTYPNRRKVPLDRPIQWHSAGLDADGHEIAELASATHFDTCPKAEKYRKIEAGPVKPILQGKLF